MPKNSILILEKKEGLWHPFLEDYFGDVPVAVKPAQDPTQSAFVFDKLFPRAVFVEPEFLNKALLQKLKVRKNTDPAFRIFLLAANSKDFKEITFDAVFPASVPPADFNKVFLDALPMPETVRILVVDDEEEVATMIRDYFEGRKSPSFMIRYAVNGKKGLDAILKEKPDLIVLDIKMPVMDGRELYAELKNRKLEIPVVIFFDSICGEELAEIRKHGNPPVVEKGTPASSLPALMGLVKKIIWLKRST